MANFKIKNTNIISNAMDLALESGALQMLSYSKSVVPRDLNRLPKPIILKKKLKPERNIRKGNKHHYRNPVMIGGNWYEGITGNLANSLSYEKIKTGNYKVGVKAGITEEYAKALEFGTLKMKKRSFLKEPFEIHKKELKKHIQSVFNEILYK